MKTTKRYKVIYGDYSHFYKVTIDQEAGKIFESKVVISDSGYSGIDVYSYSLSTGTHSHDGRDECNEEEFKNALHNALALISEQDKK